jgi:hypothetical protein
MDLATSRPVKASIDNIGERRVAALAVHSARLPMPR